MKNVLVRIAAYLTGGLFVGFALWFMRGQHEPLWSPVFNSLPVAMGLGAGVEIRRRTIKRPPNPADEF